jgi:DNA-binding ferritin-like protein (Dps family)
MGVRIIQTGSIEGEGVMEFWDKITGNDLRRELKRFQARANQLPEDYQAAWVEINANLWQRGDFTGRNLLSILDGVLGLLEETAVDGRSAREVLGDDIQAFCVALADEAGAKSFRDRWREQLNQNIARKLGK